MSRGDPGKQGGAMSGGPGSDVRQRLQALDGTEVAWDGVTGTFDSDMLGLRDDMISNIHVLPKLGGRVVLARTRDHGWELPGGTREPGESVLQCVVRETREEVGGVVETFDAVGWLRCTSSHDRPYRPHIPHPRFAIVIGIVELRHVVSPSDWETPEQHCEVSILPADDAFRRLRATPGQELFASVVEAAWDEPVPRSQGEDA